MKTRLIATVSALMLTALAGTSVRAGDAEATLAWQQPGYVMEVVVVTASRSEVLAAVRKEAIAAARARDRFMRSGQRFNWFGAPAR